MRVFEIKVERGEIEAALLHIRVVALEAVLIEEGVDGLRRGSKGGDGKDEKSGVDSHGDL
jgi:hypothetical protein